MTNHLSAIIGDHANWSQHSWGKYVAESKVESMGSLYTSMIDSAKSYWLLFVVYDWDVYFCI